MKRRYLWLLVIFVVAGALLACEREAFRPPAEVVKNAYMTANAGNYPELEDLLSYKLLNAIKGEVGVYAGGMPGYWGRRTKNGTITEVEILDEAIEREEATVRFRLHFEDGSTEEMQEKLVKQKTGWKLTI